MTVKYLLLCSYALFFKEFLRKEAERRDVAPLAVGRERDGLAIKTRPGRD